MNDNSSTVQVPVYVPLTGRFLRFACVGVVGTAAHYLVLAALVEFARLHVEVATTCGFAVGALVNYALNRRFTFVTKQSHGVALTKFMVVSALGAGINLALMAELTRNLGVHYLPAQVISTGIVLLWNFGANAAWTFRR